MLPDSFNPIDAEFFLNRHEMEATIVALSKFSDDDFLSLRKEFSRIRWANSGGRRLTKGELAAHLKVNHFVIDALADSHDQQIQQALERYAPKVGSIEEFTVANSQIVSVADVVESCTRLSVDLIAHLRSHYSDIQKIPPDIVEHLIAEFFSSWQYADVRTVGRDSSTGADVHALFRETNAGIDQRIFIEVKRIAHPVEIDVIRALHGAVSLERAIHGWNLGMIVTTSWFRDYKILRDVALDRFSISLKDETDLRRWLDDYVPHSSGLHLPNPKTRMS